MGRDDIETDPPPKRRLSHPGREDSDPPTIMKPAPRPGSRDSFGAVPDELANQIFQELKKTNKRLEKYETRLADVEAAVLGLREMKVSLKELTTEVRDVLRRDPIQEQRIGALEERAKIAGKDAGHDAGKDAGRGSGGRWGALAGLIAAVAAALAERFVNR